MQNTKSMQTYDRCKCAQVYGCFANLNDEFLPYIVIY